MTIQHQSASPRSLQTSCHCSTCSRKIRSILDTGRKAVKEGRIPSTEEGIFKWLFDELKDTPNAFKRKSVAKPAEKALPGHIQTPTQAYVFVPGVLSTIAQKVKAQDLRDKEKAKYMFSKGVEFGSLADLVLQKNDTTFPLTKDKVTSVWGERG